MLARRSSAVEFRVIGDSGNPVPQRRESLDTLRPHLHVHAHKEGRFVLTEPILKKENDGRPTGNGAAGTVMPGNIEVKNTSTSVVLVEADMPPVLVGELHDGRASLNTANVSMVVGWTLVPAIEVAVAMVSAWLKA